MTTLASRQRRAERKLPDRGKALRPTGETVYSPEAQADVDELVDLFPSRCKIQARDLAARDAEVGGRTASSVRLELHLPVSSAPLERGDVWEMTAVGRLSTATVGQRFRVLAPFTKSLPTARRYEVEEVTG